MLSLRTRHDWAFSVDVTVDPDPPGAPLPVETFANAAADRSALEAIRALDLWLNDAGRAWAGLVTFTWAWARDATTSGAYLTITATGGSFSLSAGASARLGIPAVTGVTTASSTAPASGTWHPPRQLAVRRWLRRVDGAGDAAGAGALMPGVAGTAHRFPVVQTACYRQDVSRLVSILADASTPRLAWVYQEAAETWRRVALGQMRQTRVDALATRVELEVAG